MDGLATTLTVVAALGCGLMAGFFLAFSKCVMDALDRLPPAQAVVAMQTINVTVINPLVMTLLFGTGLVCVALSIAALVDWSAPESIYQIGGSALYVAGNVLVTMLFNVPRNNALAAVEPESKEGADLWSRYSSEWTAWNHARTVTALAAAALLTIALAR